jgi:magnesium chelatase subunit I
LHRCYRIGENNAVPRITDVRSAFPAIAGKLEFEYEAADAKREDVIDDLVKRAVKIVFDKYFKTSELVSVIESFQNNESVEISQYLPSEKYVKFIKSINGIENLLKKIIDGNEPAAISSGIEFILEGLHLSNQLNKEESNGIVTISGKLPEITGLKKSLKSTAH